MPIRQFLLVKQGKELGYGYRARSVEAIHICRKLEQDLVTRRDGVHDVLIPQPGAIQETGYSRSEDIRQRFETGTFAISCQLILFRILMAVWGAVQMACSTAGRNCDTDIAFESLCDLLRSYNNKNFALFINGYLTVLYPCQRLFR